MIHPRAYLPTTEPTENTEGGLMDYLVHPSVSEEIDNHEADTLK